MTRPCCPRSDGRAVQRYFIHPHGTGAPADRPLVSAGGATRRASPVLPRRGKKGSDEQTGERPSVLIAYHPMEEAERLGQLLDPNRYTITPCKDGLEALNHLARGEYDVVVTGVKMPSVDGLELISILRNHDRKIPIIAVGENRAGMDQIFLRSAALFGAFGVLAQPVEADQLQDMVRLAAAAGAGA